jgi:hypothetical protein
MQFHMVTDKAAQGSHPPSPASPKVLQTQEAKKGEKIQTWKPEIPCYRYDFTTWNKKEQENLPKTTGKVFGLFFLAQQGDWS